MKDKVIFIAPHPDDETLGCGGTILKHKENGDSINWVIITEPKIDGNFSKDQIKNKKIEIEKISNEIDFAKIFQLKFPSASLENTPIVDLIYAISEVFKKIQPTIIYLPFPGDIHTDHKIVFDSVLASCKWFRFQGIRSIRAYETLSETNFNSNPLKENFRPNFFINISKHLNKKLKIMSLYKSEIREHPFPRSLKSIKALATLRGSESGFLYAESFMLIKHLED